MQRPEQFLPGAVPADLHDRLRLLWYARDPTVPKHSANANFIVDLPFGKGKLVGRNSGKLANAVIGGWQMAGFFTLNSSYTTLTTNFFGPYNKIQTYGKQFPIQNCTSGVCYNGFLNWNGYIQANLVNRHNAAGQCTGSAECRRATLRSRSRFSQLRRTVEVPAIRMRRITRRTPPLFR